MLGAHDPVFRQVLVHAVHFLPHLLFFGGGGDLLEPDVHVIEGCPQDQLHPFPYGPKAGHVGNRITGQPAQDQAYKGAQSFNNNRIQNITSLCMAAICLTMGCNGSQCLLCRKL